MSKPQASLTRALSLARPAVFALLLVPACGKPKPPVITPKSAQVVAVTTTGIQLRVTFDVANPNRFPLSARVVDGRFLIGDGEGVELGQVHAEPSASIPAQATSSVVSDLAVGWTNLAALAPFSLAPGPVPYRFVGTANWGGESLNVTVPFTLSGSLTRAQLLQAGLAGLSLPVAR